MAITASAVQFKANLLGSLAQKRAKAVIILNGIVFTLYAKIVEKTPVRTGRARLSWMVSVYAAKLDVPPEVGTKWKEGDPPIYPEPDAGVFVAELEVAPLEVKRVIFSNVSYIVWLENGTPRMTGRHMVSSAIQEMAS